MTKGLRGRIHRDKNDICGLNFLLDCGGEEEVRATCFLDEKVETRLIDRQSVAIPCGNPDRVDVYNGDLVARTLHGDHRHGRPTDVASPNTDDLFFEIHGTYRRMDISEQNTKTFAITGSEKRGNEGAPLFTVRVDGVVGHLVIRFSNVVPFFCDLEDLPTVASRN